MKQSTTQTYAVYSILLILLTLYSYALVDPNLTLINHPFWTNFRNAAVQIGYYRRFLSFGLYFGLITALFGAHYFFVKNSKRFNAVHLAILAGAMLVISYPFLSRDFFNYLFDAKIITVYGANPYAKTALDFPQDTWLRFMHWTHRTYPYGPTFLPLTLIPSFLSFGKFVLNFIFFKAMFVGFYILSVYFLSHLPATPEVEEKRSDGKTSWIKHNSKLAIFFATSPLVLIEGLVNAHNDLIAVAFAIIGIYYLVKAPPRWLNRLLGGEKWKALPATIIFLISGGIKYITLPTVILQKPERANYRGVIPIPPRGWSSLATLGILTTIAYLSIFREIQPWYFLSLLIFLPYMYSWIRHTQIFIFGLLMSYYPYIALGDWTNPERVALKHNIIIVFLGLNLIYLFLRKKHNSLDIL